MIRSNERIAIWYIIKHEVERRVVENRRRLADCRDDEVLPILVRISQDDEKRLDTANGFIAFHQRAA